jgi:hypothetical protein
MSHASVRRTEQQPPYLSTTCSSPWLPPLKLSALAPASGGDMCCTRGWVGQVWVNRVPLAESCMHGQQKCRSRTLCLGKSQPDIELAVPSVP